MLSVFIFFGMIYDAKISFKMPRTIWVMRRWFSGGRQDAISVLFGKRVLPATRAGLGIIVFQQITGQPSVLYYAAVRAHSLLFHRATLLACQSTKPRARL